MALNRIHDTNFKSLTLGNLVDLNAHSLKSLCQEIKNKHGIQVRGNEISTFFMRFKDHLPLSILYRKKNCSSQLSTDFQKKFGIDLLDKTLFELDELKSKIQHPPGKPETIDNSIINFKLLKLRDLIAFGAKDHQQLINKINSKYPSIKLEMKDSTSPLYHFFSSKINLFNINVLYSLSIEEASNYFIENFGIDLLDKSLYELPDIESTIPSKCKRQTNQLLHTYLLNKKQLSVDQILRTIMETPPEPTTFSKSEENNTANYELPLEELALRLSNNSEPFDAFEFLLAETNFPTSELSVTSTNNFSYATTIPTFSDIIAKPSKRPFDGASDLQHADNDNSTKKQRVVGRLEG